MTFDSVTFRNLMKDEAPLEDPKKDGNIDVTLLNEMQVDATNCSDEEIQKCFDFNLKDELKGENVEKRRY